MERVRIEMLCLVLEQAPLAALSASFGVAELRVGGDSFDALFTRADQALYAAKHAGKDRVEVWREAA
jgi:PleD family two-component response regulator